MLETSLFYVFTVLTLGGALLTITRRSPVIAAVWLTVSLLGVAGLFLMLGAEFLFVAQIIVYVGGITLLFLFVILLVNLEAASTAKRFRGSWPAVAAASAGLAAEFIFTASRQGLSPFGMARAELSTEAFADSLLSTYFVAFEIASVVLLAAIVGSVWMGQQRREQRP